MGSSDTLQPYDYWRTDWPGFSIMRHFARSLALALTAFVSVTPSNSSIAIQPAPWHDPIPSARMMDGWCRDLPHPG